MNRPFVYVNMAMTVDGKMTSSDREYPEFTSRDDRERMDRLRAEADALLVGAGTIRADNPPLHMRSKEMLDYRRSLGKPPELTRVTVTRSLDLDPNSRFFGNDGARRIVATIEQASTARVTQFESRAEVWRIGTDQIDLRRLLERLKEQGVDRLLVEGGGELNWSLLREDLIDEWFVTLAPSLLGGGNAPTPIEGDGFPMAHQRRLRLIEVDRVGDELFTRWAVRR